MKKPDYPGSWHGQLTTVCQKEPKILPNGKIHRIPVQSKSADEKKWMTVKIVTCKPQWVWDSVSREWLSEADWQKKYPAKSAGKVLVSKNSQLHQQLADRQKRSA
jgi:hypothetical protein